MTNSISSNNAVNARILKQAILFPRNTDDTSINIISRG